jgi:uncharacterized protein with HEPN domain
MKAWKSWTLFALQLIAIGESVKKLDKITNGSFLSQYSRIEWRRVMGMRDILSHHYFDLDAEVVYSVCTEHIEVLEEVVGIMITDIESHQPTDDAQ